MDWANLLFTKRERESDRMKTELRSEFERDYDRAIFSTPIRRLHDKAQVFPLEPLDAVRTRLTHSLEVSTVARDLADAAGKWLLDKKHLADHDQLSAIRSIAATCALIHDLGNPPFGHIGEVAIREWFEKRLEKDENFFREFGSTHDDGRTSQYAQDFLRFEGNAQTLRLVARLQVLADQHGLNLTHGTLSAAQKYLAKSHEVRTDRLETKKVGHFASENGLIGRVRETTRTGESRNPITYLVEASDDAVYLVVDLEDGVKKRVIDWGTLKDEVRSAASDPDLVDECLEAGEQQINKGTAKLAGQDRDEAYAVAFRIASIVRCVPAALEAFRENYDAIMEGEFHRDLLTVSKAAPLLEACRKVCTKYVYHSVETLRLEVMGRHVIQDLMDVFWEGLRDWPTQRQSQFGGIIYELLSPNYRTVFEHSVKDGKLPEKYCKLQLVTDYVAGMTDTFACTLHKRLTNR
jgi:dGTPase